MSAVRALLFSGASLLLSVCARASSQSDILPIWVTPYTVDGSLSWSKFDWVATLVKTDRVSQEQSRSLILWANARQHEQTAKILEDIKRAGLPANTLREDCYGDDDCQIVLDAEDLAKKFDDPRKLMTAAREAVPAIESFRLAVNTAWHIVQTDPKTSDQERLHAAYLCDQSYLVGITGFQYPARRLPQLSSRALQIFNFGLNVEFRKQARAHAQVVKELVARQGWPKRSDIGERAQRDAWLVVQHDDEDPLFQYQVLRAMEPIANAGETSVKDFAYLYDRVNLKIVGKQRYGTQLTCVSGHLEAQPLELADRLDQYRKEASLPPFSEYLSSFPNKDNCAG